jgi:hypothetical protein
MLFAPVPAAFAGNKRSAANGEVNLSLRRFASKP